MRFDNSGTATAPASPAKPRFDNTGQAEPWFKLPDISAPGYWGGVAERGKGLARAGIEGVTLGLAGRGAALLNSQLKDEPYQQAWDEQKQMRQDAAASLDAINPGTYAATELAGSLINPFGRVSNAALPAKVGNWGRGLAYGAEGATTGAASAFGHDQDPLTGAAVGGAGGAALPWAAAAAPYLGKAAALPIGLAGTYYGGRFAGTPGAYLGTLAGTTAGAGIGSVANQIADKSVSTATGRDLLAELASAPGRLYGWMKGTGQ